MSELFYLQDTRSIVGNSMSWWALNGCGYVCDIRKAHRFSKDEANKIASQSKHFRPWPCSYIDERVSYHVDCQLVNHEQAVAARSSAPPKRYAAEGGVTR